VADIQVIPTSATPAAKTVNVPAPSVIARPALFAMLTTSSSRGVTFVVAPAGSGKTVLLRAWVEHAALTDRVAWVSVERAERDAQRFWSAVVESLRGAPTSAALIDKLAEAPEFDGSALVERLVSQLASLEAPVILVIDDLHELQSRDGLVQLQQLIARRPPLLRVVLASRDPQLELHRLRVAEQLGEVRATELRFTLRETAELLSQTGHPRPD
jgi:LuxR family maltose regulon positive regulatory protein